MKNKIIQYAVLYVFPAICTVYIVTRVVEKVMAN